MSAMVPLGAGSTPLSAAAPSTSGLASTPMGAAQDAMLYADILVRHEAELIQNGSPASESKPRGDDAIAALDAAKIALDQGFAALTPDQLAALERAGNVILLNVSSATPGGTITPGSDVILTPVNASDALANGTASAAPGQSPALTLGGTLVSVGGTPPSQFQPGASLNLVPLNGAPMYLRSAAPNQIVAHVPTFTPIGVPQLIVLSTADGRLAIGVVKLQHATGTLQFSAPTYTWGQNGLTANVLVTRTGGSSGTTAALFSTSDGTAKAGVDYTMSSSMVIFGDGDSHPRLVSIPLLAGNGTTGDKTIGLALSDPMNGASIGTQATATLTLQNGLSTIQGQVFEDPNRVGQFEAGDVGLANALVFLDLNGDGVLNNPASGNNVGDLNATEPFTVADSQGNYSLGALAPGTYTVRVVLPNGQSTTTAATRALTIGGTGTLFASEDFGLAPTVLTAGSPGTPTLSAQSDTGASATDGLTRDNGSAAAPLVFNVTETGGSGDFFRLYDVTNASQPVLIAGPVQAPSGTVTVSGNGLSDGTHRIAATTAISTSSNESAVSASTGIAVQTSVIITGTNPGDGTVVMDKLPNGQFVVTFNHPLAGLSDGQSPIQDNAPFNPYDVFLLARGPDLQFTAPKPDILNGGDLPLHAEVVYHINVNGTSEFDITPTEPMSTDVFAVSVNLASFSDLAGNPLTDPLGGAPGYRTFLFQKSAFSSQPLAVVGITEFNGSTPVSGAVAQPDTISIQFNKPLFVGAAGNGNVQLIANPGPNFTVVPSVAAYSPTTNSIELTPTVPLTPATPLFPGTQYAVRVAGKDGPTTPSYVSDDQGFGSPDSNGALPHTVFDLFTVKNAPAGAGSSPLTVAVDAQGNPKLLPLATNNNAWGQAIGYVSAQFTEPLDVASLGHYSAMFIPWKGGLNDNGADAGDVPLNATIAFNPNTNELIIVPSQPVGSGVYVDSLSSMKAMNTDPLMNDAGLEAGVSGLAYYRSFFEQAPGVSALAVTGSHASDLVAAPVVSGALVGPSDPVVVNIPVSKPRSVVVRSRPVQPLSQPAGAGQRLHVRPPLHPAGPLALAT